MRRFRAQVTGYLTTQNYKEGSLVKKGDVLFTIDQRPFRPRWRRPRQTMRRRLQRRNSLGSPLAARRNFIETKVISQQEYDTAYQNAQADTASVAAAQANVQSAQINLNYCTITAPFDGIAGIAQAQIGDLVGPGGTAVGPHPNVADQSH